MKLRQWQIECITLALRKYSYCGSHFLVMATPGAGKTRMTAELADRLFQRNEIDLVFCFSPRSIVSQDFSDELALRLNARLDGTIGALGQTFTYQTLQYLPDSFWQLFEQYRVFVIFDEIHHCAGSNLDNANAWGQEIMLKIMDKAKYTISLTGTPWRSDTAPIVLSKYANDDGNIQCDYSYGLTQAINDDVCLQPNVVVIDNDAITADTNGKMVQYGNFVELLAKSETTYQDLITHKQLIIHMLREANLKLTKIRRYNPTAGGLIVAHSDKHANQIATLLSGELNETATVVTYKKQDASGLIKQFRNSDQRWIISIGMISEGTNIPRLQVCCHLTDIRTELHFRQFIGRLLRVTTNKNKEAILFMPSERKLLEYAHRLNQDIPSQANIVTFKPMKKAIAVKSTNTSHALSELVPLLDANTDLELGSDMVETATQNGNMACLSLSYDRYFDITGKFKQASLQLGLSSLPEVLGKYEY